MESLEDIKKVSKEDLVESAVVVENENKSFGWESDTWKIPKYITSDTSFNLRSFYNKAFKAYQKGNRTFRYRDQMFIVPVTTFANKNNSINKNLEELMKLAFEVENHNDKIDSEVEDLERNLESLNSIKQWL